MSVTTDRLILRSVRLADDGMSGAAGPVDVHLECSLVDSVSLAAGPQTAAGSAGIGYATCVERLWLILRTAALRAFDGDV